MTTTFAVETVSGTITSWLPLTTVFTPPAICSSVFLLEDSGLMAYDPGHGYYMGNSIVCGPSVVTSRYSGASNGVFSIGPVTCPLSWTTMLGLTKDTISTEFLCCPPNYKVGSTNLFCSSGVASGGTLTYVSSVGTTGFATKTTVLSASSTVVAIPIVGWNLNVQVASSTTSTSTSSTTGTSTVHDQSTATTQTTSTTTSPPSTLSTSLIPLEASSTTSSTSSASAAISPLAGTSGNSTEGGGWISTRTAVGIGVGAGLGVAGLAAILVGYFVMRQRRKRKTLGGEGSLVELQSPDAKFGFPPGPGRPEMDMDRYVELPADPAHGPAELAGGKSEAMYK